MLRNRVEVTPRGVMTEKGYLRGFWDTGYATCLGLSSGYMVWSFLKIHWNKILRYTHFIVCMAYFNYKNWPQTKTLKESCQELTKYMTVYKFTNRKFYVNGSSKLSFGVVYYGISLFAIWKWSILKLLWYFKIIFYKYYAKRACGEKSVLFVSWLVGQTTLDSYFSFITSGVEWNMGRLTRVHMIPFFRFIGCSRIDTLLHPMMCNSFSLISVLM